VLRKGNILGKSAIVLDANCAKGFAVERPASSAEEAVITLDTTLRDQ